MLANALDTYLAVRRATGFELRVPEILLRSFVRFAKARGDTHVVAQTAIDWAAQAPSLGQRDYRLKTVIRFARYARAEDTRHELPPGHFFGYHRQRPVPFIFSPMDIGRLIQAASCLGPPGSLRPHVYSTLLALLAVSGLRISEALALCFDDVTADGLLVRETKFKKSRLVPLHETAVAALAQYLMRRRRVGGADDHLFISIHGQELRYDTVHETFRTLVDGLGLRPKPGQKRPSLHSLRHTFAVRALEACPSDSRDRVGQHMLALSTYLGHARITDTYWYLETTPQLMTDIASASESLLAGGEE